MSVSLRSAVLLCGSLLAGGAHASDDGMPSSGFPASMGCNHCHGGGAIPTVALSAPTLTVEPGSAPITLTATISGVAAGMDLQATGGTLNASDPGTHMLSGEVVHDAPRAAVAGVVTFTASWTPPAQTGNVTLTLWGNSVNLDGLRFGDRAAKSSLSIKVCDPAAAEFCDGIDNNCDGTVDNGTSDMCPPGWSCIAADCVAPGGGGGGGGGTDDAGVPAIGPTLGDDSGGCSTGVGGPAVWALMAAFGAAAARRRNRS